MADTLRVAIIGTGMIANAGHIPAWQDQADDVEVVAVANPRRRKAELTAERHGIPHVYSDWRGMLADLEPDVVSICTPNVSHHDIAIGALNAGCHVLVEKPIATTYAEARDMFEAAERADRLLYVGQTGRWSNRTMAAQRIVSTGRLGEIYYAETSAMRRRGVPTWGRFHMEEASGGGPVLDLGVHVLDALFWIMGNPKVRAVSSVTYTKLADRDEGLVTSLADSGAPVGVFQPRAFSPEDFDVEDMAAGFLRLEKGITLSFKTSWAANVPPDAGGSYILGTEAGLRLNPLLIIGKDSGYQADTEPIVPPDPDVPFYGHWQQAEHLVRVLRGQEEPLVTKDEVLNVMRALEGLYLSAREGREVWFDEARDQYITAGD